MLATLNYNFLTFIPPVLDDPGELLFVPDAFYDVISGDLIEDPVIASDNRTYSRRSITDWFSQCRRNGEVVDLLAPNVPHIVIYFAH